MSKEVSQLEAERFRLQARLAAAEADALALAECLDFHLQGRSADDYWIQPDRDVLAKYQTRIEAK